MTQPPRHLDSGKIRRLRERRGLTVDDLAYNIKVHPQSLRKIERGDGGASLDMAVRIADGLGVELPEIIKPRSSGNGPGRAA